MESTIQRLVKDDVLQRACCRISIERGQEGYSWRMVTHRPTPPHRRHCLSYPKEAFHNHRTSAAPADAALCLSLGRRISSTIYDQSHDPDSLTSTNKKCDHPRPISRPRRQVATRPPHPPHATITTAARVTQKEEYPHSMELALAMQAGAAPRPSDPPATIKFIPHREQRSSRPSLDFEAISKTLRNPTAKIKIGRYTDRDQSLPDESALAVGFKSKVVSRRHCELWCTSGQWYIKDVKSSSGTFLNHMRLSGPNAESRPFAVKDGDIIQLGIDFKGGESEIFRCVKIRIECNRGWQKALNPYNISSHQDLLGGVTNPGECSICLNRMLPNQALFRSECGHLWHFKCIRKLLMSSDYPHFLCPNCRLHSDLEANVEQPEDEGCDWMPEPVVTEPLGDQAGGASSSSDEIMSNHGEPTAPMSIDAVMASDSDSAAEARLEARLASDRPTQVKTPGRRTNSPRFIHLGDQERTPESVSAAARHLLTPRNNAGPFVLDGSAGAVDD